MALDPVTRFSIIPDVNECVLPAGTARCVFGCVNTPGSFRCLCPAGYSMNITHGHCEGQSWWVSLQSSPRPFNLNTWYYRLRFSWAMCLCLDGTDLDECRENAGLGPCANACVNTPGSFHCACSDGSRLAGDGRTCISECPPGYRRKPSDPTVGDLTALPCVGKCRSLQETGCIVIMSVKLLSSVL